MLQYYDLYSAFSNSVLHLPLFHRTPLRSATTHFAKDIESLTGILQCQRLLLVSIWEIFPLKIATGNPCGLEDLGGKAGPGLVADFDHTEDLGSTYLNLSSKGGCSIKRWNPFTVHQKRRNEFSQLVPTGRMLLLKDVACTQDPC